MASSTKIIYISGYHSGTTISHRGSASEGKRVQNQDLRMPRCLRAYIIFSPASCDDGIPHPQPWCKLSFTLTYHVFSEKKIKIEETRLCLSSLPIGDYRTRHLGACFKDVLWVSLPLVWDFKRQRASVCRVTRWECVLPVPFPKMNWILCKLLKHLKPEENE